MVEPDSGKSSLLSSANILMPRPIWCRLELQLMVHARCLALLNAGSSSAARMAMMAITTSNSINVNARSMEVGFRDFIMLSSVGTAGKAPQFVLVVLLHFSRPNSELHQSGRAVKSAEDGDLAMPGTGVFIGAARAIIEERLVLLHRIEIGRAHV